MASNPFHPSTDRLVTQMFPHVDSFADRVGRSCKRHSFANMDIMHSCPTLQAPNMIFRVGRSWTKQPIGSFDSCLQHVNRTTGITAEAVDSPEALSLSIYLRGGFTRAAGKRMNIRVDSRTAFGFMTAILQVLDGIAWPWNQAGPICRSFQESSQFRQLQQVDLT